MHSNTEFQEEPKINQMIPKMFIADTSIPKPNNECIPISNDHQKSKNPSKEINNNKNLSIQTDLLAYPKNMKKFDLKTYLNRNSPKYFNLKEKLQNFQLNVKSKNITSASKQRNQQTPNTSDNSNKKNTQSTIDQTPKLHDQGNSRISSSKKEDNVEDYENNFIIAKINNFFKGRDQCNNASEIPNAKQDSQKRKPNLRQELSLNQKEPKPKEKKQIKSVERPKTTFQKRRKSGSCLKEKSEIQDHLFMLTEGNETEDLHNRYEKELKTLFGKDVLMKKEKIAAKKKKVASNSLFLMNNETKTMKNNEKNGEKIEKKLKKIEDEESKGARKEKLIEKKHKKQMSSNQKTIKKEEKKNYDVSKQPKLEENPQIPLCNETLNTNNSEEIKTREKKKTLEKFITQINRGEIFAKPIEESEEKPKKKNLTKKISSKVNEKKENIKKDIKTQEQNNKKPNIIVKKIAFFYYSSSLAASYRSADLCDYFVQLYKEHFTQTFQALNYCKGLTSPDLEQQIEQKKVILTKRKSHKSTIFYKFYQHKTLNFQSKKAKKTLIFDLDETLIHCNEMMDVESDVILPITFPNGEIIEAGINIRPYLFETLNSLKDMFEIIVFTASHNCYANKVLDYLDPKQEYFHHRLFREHCIVSDEGIHIKDLRILSNRNISDIVIVDNACYSFGYQIDNGVPIIPYYDNKKDMELKHLADYLKLLVNNDIQETNRKNFKLYMYQQYQNMDELAEILFED